MKLYVGGLQGAFNWNFKLCKILCKATKDNDDIELMDFTDAKLCVIVLHATFPD